MQLYNCYSFRRAITAAGATVKEVGLRRVEARAKGDLQKMSGWCCRCVMVQDG
jgi:hypothetical protein